MIFENPTLFKVGTFKAFLNYAKQYNSDKPKGQRIRKQHKSLFNDILYLYDVFLNKEKELKPNLSLNIKPEDLPSFNTNNVKLLTAFTYEFKEIAYDEDGKPITYESDDTCVRTIQNYISRLVTAGVITKINHGLGCEGGKIRASKAEQAKKNYSRFSYDLIINPEILVLFDFANPEKAKNPKFLNASESELSELLRKTFPEFRFLQRTTINKINSNDTNESGVLTANENSGSETENISANSAVCSEHNLNPSGKFLQGHQRADNAAEELELKKAIRIFEQETDVQKLLAVYLRLGEVARWRLRTTVIPFVSLKVRKLVSCGILYREFIPIMQGKEIPQPVYYQTIEYIYHNYFKGADTQSSLDTRLAEYTTVLTMVRKWINRENFNMRNVYPMAYFDLNNVGINPVTKKQFISFANARKWFTKNKEYQENAAKRTKDSNVIKKVYVYANTANREMSKNPKNAAEIMHKYARLVTDMGKDDATKAMFMGLFESIVAGGYKVKPTNKKAA